MITYLIGIVVTFFLLIFIARKFNNKFNFYRNSYEGRTDAILVIGLVSVFWMLTIPLALVVGFFAFVVKSSTKLLK
jgi:cytochrome c biogenesis protein CcdA